MAKEKTVEELIKESENWWEKTDEPIHKFFGLSYAQFLVLSRTVLQSMPLDWQKRFVKCLMELDAEIDVSLKWPWQYHVTVRNLETRRFGSLKNHDPYGSYDRGRARVKLNSDTSHRCSQEDEDSAIRGE